MAIVLMITPLQLQSGLRLRLWWSDNLQRPLLLLLQPTVLLRLPPLATWPACCAAEAYSQLSSFYSVQRLHSMEWCYQHLGCVFILYPFFEIVSLTYLQGCGYFKFSKID